MPITDLVQARQAPLSEELTRLLQATKPKEPSLLDTASAYFRAGREGTSLGAQLDLQQQNQMAEAQTQLGNHLQVADYIMRQAEMKASQGEADAAAFRDAIKDLTSGLSGQDVAEIILKAEALPDPIGRTNAYSTVAQLVREGGYQPEAEAPETREVKIDGKIVTQEARNGEWITIAEAPRFAPTTPEATAFEKTVGALRNMGVELSTKDLRIMAGVESVADPNPTIVKLQAARDQAAAEGRADDATEIQRQIDAIGTVTGRTAEDMAVLGTGSKVDEATLGAAQETANIDTYRNLFSQLDAVGEGATGLRGAIAETGGGLLAQVNTGLGEGFSQAISGATQEEITQFRTDARIAVSRLIPSVTGEESGRFTEQERALATQASRLLSPDASFAQIKAALTSVTKLAFLDREKQLFLSGRPFTYDLSSEDGRRQAVADYLATGLSEDAALDLLTRSIRFQDELAGMRGDG